MYQLARFLNNKVTRYMVKIIRVHYFLVNLKTLK